MSHSYYGGSVWRYHSALDPACHYETADEARKADHETAVSIVAEQTPETLLSALFTLDPHLRDALDYLVGEMSAAVEAPEAFDGGAKL
jgi:hypothetical protein